VTELRPLPVTDWMAWLFSLTGFGMKLGLEAVSALLEELDRPCFDRPGVLVAGTNGKGSTAAMTAALLTAWGARTVLFTSPHVASVTERIRINGRPIPERTLIRHLKTIRAASHRLVAAASVPHHPTFFETLTAAALLHGRDRRVDAVVLEVGLGGRYDATNAFPARVGVITNIGLDHVRHLGPTLPSIAANKAGIIKPGQTLICGERRPEAYHVLRGRARERGACLVRLPARAARQRRDGSWDLDLSAARRAAGITDRGGTTLSAGAAGKSHAPDDGGSGGRSETGGAGGGRLPELSGVRLAMEGVHQGRNAAIAVAAATALAAVLPGIEPRPEGIRLALGRARLPGRFELRRLGDGRLLILDGGHNADAAEVLAETVRRRLPGRPLTLLFGVMADKNTDRMGRTLFPLARRVVLCRPDRKRTLPPSRLLPVARELGISRRVVADPCRAFDLAVADTPRGGVLLVTGSFFLLGDIWPRVAGLRRVVLRT
jgi:dihydrofolate synthase/folylpolyglutamate synthase